MKNILGISLLCFLGLVSCNPQSGSEGKGGNPKTLSQDTIKEDTTNVKEVGRVEDFGNKVNKEGAVPAHTLPALMQKQDSLNIKLRGKIVAVCPKKGCWMNIDLGNGDIMRVTFRDYGFFVPQDAIGKHAVISGTAKATTTTVASLKHYADDAGKSPQEVEAIKTPEAELVFVADGVLLEEE